MKKSKKFITAVLTFIFVLAANVFAFANSEDDAAAMLNELGIKDSGLLIEHLQTIDLSESEIEKLLEISEAIAETSEEIEAASEYPREDLLKLANLSLELAHILQMDVKFVDKNGNPIGLTDIIAQDDFMLDFQLVITDSEGNFLATIDPKALDIDELNSITNNTNPNSEDGKKSNPIVEKVLENTSEEFQPENGGRLPDTAASYGNYIIVGVSLMAFSVLGLIAARRKQAA